MYAVSHFILYSMLLSNLADFFCYCRPPFAGRGPPPRFRPGVPPHGFRGMPPGMRGPPPGGPMRGPPGPNQRPPFGGRPPFDGNYGPPSQNMGPGMPPGNMSGPPSGPGGPAPGMPMPGGMSPMGMPPGMPPPGLPPPGMVRLSKIPVILISLYFVCCVFFLYSTVRGVYNKVNYCQKRFFMFHMLQSFTTIFVW